MDKVKNWASFKEMFHLDVIQNKTYTKCVLTYLYRNIYKVENNLDWDLKHKFLKCEEHGESGN